MTIVVALDTGPRVTLNGRETFDEARALYQAMLGRYDANWYGYLAKQRLDAMARSGKAPRKTFEADSVVGRAIANLQTVTVAEETAGSAEEMRIAKADQLYERRY